MLTKSKQDRFAEQLITKEYLGITEYGKDKEYEDELTKAASSYISAIFQDKDIETTKENLIKVMNKKEPIYKSNILKILF
jgi:hypothetical protein